MKRRNLRVGEVTAAERPCNRRETADLPCEVDGQAVALAQFAIKIRHRTRLPLILSAKG